MPHQTSSLDQTTEKNTNGTIVASEKLLKPSNQQQNGNLQKSLEKVEPKDEIEEVPTADVVVPTGWYNNNYLPSFDRCILFN